MLSRQEMKRRGRHSLKRHYLLLVAVCLLAAFLGTEFGSSLSSIKSVVEENAGSAKVSGSQGLADVIETMLLRGEEQGRRLSEQIQEAEIEAAREADPVFGRTRGVLAGLVNAYTSGGIFVSVLSALDAVTGSETASRVIFVLLSLAFVFLVWYFIRDAYRVIARRITLEACIYEKVPARRFLFLLRVRRWAKVAWTLFVTQVFQVLWMFTIVGFFVKRYSYYMVPYILAENPDIPTLEAITLSRRMMRGHKWQCFVFQLSFLGWLLLEIPTLGLGGILYSNPYQMAAFGEYYTEIRRLAKEQGIPGAEYLNDTYLFEKAKNRILTGAYPEVSRRERKEEKAPGGIRGFLAAVFGISLYGRKTEQVYEERERERVKNEELEDALSGKAYPGRLFPIPEHERRKWVESLNYMRRYTPVSLILMFFCFCFIGWIFEVSQGFVASGEFIKRGVLHGPWLPIYGMGGILILVVLYRLRKRPLWEFIMAVVLCGGVEYFTALNLELTHGGMKWWDYSGYFLNIHGRVCAEGLLVFGIMGLVIVYVVAPLLDNLLKKIPMKIAVPACAVLLALFAADQAYSAKHPNTGHGITDIGEETAAGAEKQEELL